MALTAVKPESATVESGDPEMLSKLLQSELCVFMTSKEIVECQSFESIAEVVHARLKLDFEGNSIPDIFTKLEWIAKEELHASVYLEWFSLWKTYETLGSWWSPGPSWLDYVEMFLRIEEEFKVKMNVTTRSLEHMPITVGETVKRIWQQRQPQPAKNLG